MVQSGDVLPDCRVGRAPSKAKRSHREYANCVTKAQRHMSTG